MAYLIGIDVGTTGVKGVLIDREGRVLGNATTPKDDEIPRSAPEENWSEQNPEDWVKYSFENIKSLLKESKVNSAHVVAVGVSAQMHGGVFLDKDGRVLRPAIIWDDKRTGKQYEFIMQAYRKDVGHFTVAKGLWLKENESDIFARASTMCLPEDYVAYRLTGTVSTTEQGLSQMRAWDFSKGAIDDALLRELGLRHLIPEVLPNMGDHGRITAEAAGLTGLKEGTPVTARLGDQESASTGVGAVEEGYASLNSGASGIIDVVTEAKSDLAGNGIYKFLQTNNLGLIIACTLGCGLSYQWGREAFASDLKTKAKEEGINVYELMNREAEKAPPGSGGLIFLPYGNNGDRSPIDDSTIRGALLGIDFNIYSGDEAGKQRAYALRAILEGIAHSFRHNQEVLALQGVTLKKARAAKTGVLSSDLFAQMVADHLNIPIEFVSTEGGCFGVALAAGVGAGIYSSIEEACQKTITPAGTVEPIPEDRGPLTEAYSRYVAIYQALASR